MIAEPRPLVLVDLDNTLFQTRSKLDPGVSEGLRVAATDRHGEPYSFMTPKQGRFFDWLSRHAEVIPVTARDRQELDRVRLPFRSWQICSHGAVVLSPEGHPDASWQDRIVRQLITLGPALSRLEEVCRRSIEALGIEARVRLHREYGGHGVYLVVKHADPRRSDELALLAVITARSSKGAWFYVHRNGNNLAFLPRAIDKGVAVRYLLRHCLEDAADRPILGWGDSLSDLHFLRVCDWFGTPNRGQLAAMIDSDVLGTEPDAVEGEP